MCVHVKVTHMAFFSALLIDRVEGIAVANSRSYVILLFLLPLRYLDTRLRFYQTKISFPGSSAQTCRAPELGGTIEIIGLVLRCVDEKTEA